MNNNIKYICGVDVGFSGAIAIIDRLAEVYKIYDMPIIQSNGRKDLDMVKLISIFRDLPHRTVIHIEAVSSMPNQGVRSVFTFGFQAGMIEGILGTLGYDIHKTYSSKWKRAYFKPKSTKKDSLKLARRRYGKEHFPLEKHDGRAEACLIADYYREFIMK